jgi:serine/threonine protein kinase
MTTPNADPFDLVGTTVAGKYDIEEVVALTGLSVVYRATHRVWQRAVAIKAFAAPALSEEARLQLLASFVEEGRLLIDLSERCASICQARDVGSLTTPAGDWVPYTVLEWLDGECLEFVLRRERAEGVRPRTLAEALELLNPIATALAVAHRRGVAHCDVKPGNLFVLRGDDGEVSHTKLLDFGVAKVSRGAPGWRTGGDASQSFTPSYGAPEQFSAAYGATGPWTDVFAFALILVELLVGHEPLQGEFETLSRLSCDPDVRPTARTLGATVGDDVERVFQRALAVRPEDRYPDMGALWTALRGAVARDAQSELEVTWEPLEAAAGSNGPPSPAGHAGEFLNMSIPIALQRRACAAPHTMETTQ